MKDLLFFFLGASLGSFFGLYLDRFPHMSILMPASHCFSCQKKLAFWQMIPIISQILVGSRCPNCRASFSKKYLLIECFFACLFLLASLDYIPFSHVALISFSSILTLFDIKNQAYPFGLWLVFQPIFFYFFPFSWIFYLFLALGILSLLLKIPIGEGDLFYLATISLVFPVTDLPMIIFLSSLSAISYILLIRTQKAIPFVPFLSFSSILFLFI